MPDMTIPTDIEGERINPLLGSRVPCHCGMYVRGPDGEFRFVPDDPTRVRLALLGFRPPASLPADRLSCWRAVPSRPLIGGFVHPQYGFYCRSSAIPDAWDGMQFRVRGGLSDASAGGSMAPVAQAAADRVASLMNTSLSREPWWLYTLPVVVNGRPVVRVGIKADMPPSDISFARALAPGVAEGRRLGVDVERLAVRPAGMGEAPIESVPSCCGSGLGSAPVVSMPTGMLNWDRRTGYDGQSWDVSVPPGWAR